MKLLSIMNFSASSTKKVKPDISEKEIAKLQGKGAFHLRRFTGNVAGKLGNAYLSHQNRHPATCFPLTATLHVAMLVIPVLPVE